MPAPSKIDLMDDGDRAELDRRIVANGFGGYVELSDWLAEQGYEIGKSAIGERGKRLKRKLGQIRASTEAARMIASAAPDDADERSNAIISLVQTEIFESLLQLEAATDEEDPAKRVEILGKAAKNIATLTRASVSRNKWAVEMRKKVDAASAEIKKIASNAGVSEETMAAIDARLQGVV